MPENLPPPKFRKDKLISRAASLRKQAKKLNNTEVYKSVTSQVKSRLKKMTAGPKKKLPSASIKEDVDMAKKVTNFMRKAQSSGAKRQYFSRKQRLKSDPRSLYGKDSYKRMLGDKTKSKETIQKAFGIKTQGKDTH